MKVYLNETIHPKAVELLQSQVEIVNSFDEIEELDGILSRGTAVTAEMMNRAVKLKVIGKHGVGVNKIDLDAARAHGIRVVNTPLANRTSVAELVVGLVLNCARKIPNSIAAIQNNQVKRIADPSYVGLELSGRTFGVIGMGNIAQSTANIFRSGFGMKTIGFDPFVSAEESQKRGFQKFDSLEEMLENSDVVSIHVQLNEGTKNMIGAEQFKHFKRTGILINTSRGGIVDENALLDALKTKQLYAAACDTFVKEPPNAENSELFLLSNFLGTPHIGACTEESMYRVGMTVVEEILRVLHGEEPRYAVV